MPLQGIATLLWHRQKGFLILGLITLDFFLKINASSPVLNNELVSFLGSHPFSLSLQVSFGTILSWFLFLSLNYLDKKNDLPFNAGITLFIAGLLGNVLDRILYGNVIDYIPIHLLGVVCNLADIYIITGVGICLFSLIKRAPQLWQSFCRRKSVIIYKSFQVRYILENLRFSVVLQIALGLFFYVYIQQNVESIYLKKSFLQAYLWILLGWNLIYVVFLLFQSTKIAGSIKGIKRSLSQYDHHIKLREGDYFSEFF